MLLAAATASGLSLLVYVIVGILIVGLAYWVASLLLPHPIPTIVAIVVALIVLLWLL